MLSKCGFPLVLGGTLKSPPGPFPLIPNSISAIFKFRINSLASSDSSLASSDSSLASSDSSLASSDISLASYDSSLVSSDSSLASSDSPLASSDSSSATHAIALGPATRSPLARRVVIAERHKPEDSHTNVGYGS